LAAALFRLGSVDPGLICSILIRAFDLFNDLTDAGRPDERFGILVPGFHEVVDRLY